MIGRDPEGGGLDIDGPGGIGKPRTPDRPASSNAKRSASYGRPYPIVYGTSAVAGVPLWVYDMGDQAFQFWGASGPTETMRAAEVQYAFGFGPIVAIDSIVYNKRLFGAGSSVALTYLGTAGNPPETFIGDGSATAWAHYAAQDISTRIPWPMLALMRSRFFPVPGGAGTIPEIKAVVRGKFATTANTKRTAGGTWTRYDATPGEVLRDLLENTAYGLGLPSGTVVTAVGAGGDAASSYDRYCSANGWQIALTIDGEDSLADIVAQILLATNSVGVWSGASFKIIPLGDVAVGTYAPHLTALGLDNDDFVAAEGEDAIATTRRAWADTFNVVPVEYSADTSLRDAELAITEEMDVANVSTFGVRRGETVTLPCIRSKEHAAEISGILARRSCYHRSVFEFKITARQGAALECGDLVALTHDVMGFSNRLARVEAIEARSDGTYRVEAREWVTGASVTVTTTPEGAAGLGNNPVPDVDPFTAIGAMGDDGVIAPVEKPALWEMLQSFYKTFLEMGSGPWMPGDAITYNTKFAGFWTFLESAGSYSHGWHYEEIEDPEGGGLSPSGTMAGDWQAALAAWMLETDVLPPNTTLGLTGAQEWRRRCAIIHQEIASFRQSQIRYVSTGPTNVILDVVGDGEADDTEAIQAALDANAGGVVTLPVGNFLITDKITVPANTVLRGAGDQSQIWWEGTGDYDEGAGYGQTGTAGILVAGNGVALEDFLIFGSGAESYVAGERCIAVVGPSSGDPIRSIRITNVVATECGDSPILFVYVNGFTVKDSEAASGGLHGIDVYGCVNGRIHANTVQSVRPGDPEGAGGPTSSIRVVNSKDISVQTNTVRDWQDNGMYLSGNDGVQVQENRIIELTADSFADATGILIAADDAKVLVSGNSVITGTGTQPDVGLDYSANDTNPVTIGANDFTDAVTPYSPGTATYSDGLP